jgi:hypothetical protein
MSQFALRDASTAIPLAVVSWLAYKKVGIDGGIVGR